MLFFFNLSDCWCRSAFNMLCLHALNYKVYDDISFCVQIMFPANFVWQPNFHSKPKQMWWLCTLTLDILLSHLFYFIFTHFVCNRIDSENGKIQRALWFLFIVRCISFTWTEMSDCCRAIHFGSFWHHAETTVAVGGTSSVWATWRGWWKTFPERNY